ncbi:hypothetical protein BAUCODRAFT_39680 [Baudoinia panamericana UAMH 10762]|uniref:Tyrosine specific protein phosphatases domain-containing protein n=1 Tax=Baudoinia panamericana (strain UAMH 10762) TaxID=717646 RepID=M2MYX7_BAUPA|nr:uncharacterized protein BAUCODRAFT_39680 [Baudoinia panamericana UAMH 10762]EMC91500.1 hypothetical protein BAUCODRAFT_39680 [Baudoinia panamericana UAMH 10762]
MATSRPDKAFDNIINFRDLGAFVSRTTGREILKPGLLFRSARPDAASPSDRHRLISEYKIKTVIDLRTETERIEARRKFASRVPSAPAVTPSDPTSPLKIPGITYREIDFNGSAYTNALLEKLTYYQTAQLYALYILGYRKEAISILGSNVLAKRGLIGLAEDSLKHCTAQVLAVFNILCDQESYPVLVHCTQGKDRTGLIILLVLMLCEVPLEVIEQDYLLSERELEREKEEKVKEIRSIGLPDSFAECHADWVKKVRSCVDDKYGGVEVYLEGCGLSASALRKLRAFLTAASEAK